MTEAPIILVVDDEKINRMAISATLHGQGFNLLQAESGLDALTILENIADVDVILLDIMMPDIDGYEVLELLRANPNTAAIKVIMLSALGQPEDKVKAFTLGADDYVEKPPKKQVLLARIRTQVKLRQNEIALREGEEKLRSTIASIDDLIFTLDKNGVFLEYHQPANNSNLHTSPELFLGKLYNKVLPPPVTAQLSEAIKAVAQTGDVQQFDYQLPVDGRVKWFNTKVSMRRDHRGHYDGVTIVARDITPRKQAEIERRKLTVAAQSAAKAKGEFLATMSHEIRTPLNAIIGLTSLLLDTSLDSKQQHYLETVRKSGNALLEIINNILDFSKIEAGKLQLESHPFDLQACIEDAVEIVSPIAGKKGLKLTCRYPAGPPTAYLGDVTRLRQVLVNLLNNAVKFTATGGVTVALQSAVMAQEDLYKIHLAVKDTGIGIPPQQLDRLFKSFSQVDASTTRRFGGTGLGLAISKQLVELMDGQIWVESEEGVGSTFHFNVHLKRLGDKDKAAMQQRKAAQKYDHNLAKKYPLDILIAEDHHINQQVAQAMLEGLGYRANVAGNGLEALDALRRQDYAVILMDMQMPEMDGLQASRHIRAEFSPQKQPYIIAATANALKGDRERCLAAGMNDYISKPLRPAELTEALVKAAQSIAAANFSTTAEPISAAAQPDEPVEQPDEPAAPQQPAAAAPPPKDTTPIFDPSILAEFSQAMGEGSEEMVAMVIQSFLEDTPTMLAEIQTQIDANNAAKMRQTAHTLKGSAATVGAAKLSELSFKLQQIGDANNLSGAETVIAAARDIYRQTEQALLAEQKNSYQSN